MKEASSGKRVLLVEDRETTRLMVEETLRRRGHDVELPGGMGGFGGYQAILWDATRGVYHGATEMRKDGHVAGY